jgi:hypothetical protein
MDPDPDRYRNQPKMMDLDPDPDEMNADPQPWFKAQLTSDPAMDSRSEKRGKDSLPPGSS